MMTTENAPADPRLRLEWRRPAEGPDPLADLEATYGDGLREVVRHCDGGMTDSRRRDPDWDGTPMKAHDYFEVVADLAAGSSLTGWGHDHQLGWMWAVEHDQRLALVARVCREEGGSFAEADGWGR